MRKPLPCGKWRRTTNTNEAIANPTTRRDEIVASRREYDAGYYAKRKKNAIKRRSDMKHEGKQHLRYPEDKNDHHHCLSSGEMDVYRVWCNASPEERTKDDFFSSRFNPNVYAPALSRLRFCGLIPDSPKSHRQEMEITKAEKRMIEARTEEVRRASIESKRDPAKPATYFPDELKAWGKKWILHEVAAAGRAKGAKKTREIKYTKPRPTSGQAADAPIPEGADAESSEAG
jgi:hypothetical protein